MSKKANPTSIGLFIVVGLALGVIGLVLFSSSRLFTQTRECIMYFNDSLNGLAEGAPVKYRGVTIGSVKRVMIHFNQASNDFAMPVIVELQENLLQARLGRDSIVFTPGGLEEQVRRGMRASLQAQSLVTGVLYVEIRPDLSAPPAVYHQLEKIYVEIPTESTQIEQLMNNLASLDIKGLQKQISTLLKDLDRAVVNLQAGHISESLTNTLESVNRLVSSPEITNLLVSAQGTLSKFRLLAEKVERQVDPLAGGVTNTLAQADQTLVQLRSGVQNLRDLLSPDSVLRHDLTLALEQLGDAARSISGLADYLQRHPNALITGRPTPEKKP